MQKMNKISKDNKGFTLVELIVTVVILALVTAPFLSSFVTASNTNSKSIRLQEANELSQYIIEQCKAMSFDDIKTEYGLDTTSGTIDEAYQISPTEDNYDDKSTQYKWEISGAKGNLPSQYPEKYSAEVTITPVKSVVNSDEAIPVVDKVDKDKCAVFVNNISRYDKTTPGAVRKILTINVDKEMFGVDPPYTVTYEIKYLDGWGNSLNTIKETFRYDSAKGAPSVYILYTPLNNGGDDEIVFYNALASSEYLDDEKVSVYIVEQKDLMTGNMSDTQVTFQGTFSNPTISRVKLSDIINDNSSLPPLNTVIYTNIGTINDDKNDGLNKVVMTKKIDTLYDIEVKVSYAGKHISTYKSTKINQKK